MPAIAMSFDHYTVAFHAQPAPVAAVVTLYAGKAAELQINFRRDGAVPPPGPARQVPFECALELELLSPILDTLRSERPLHLVKGGTGTPIVFQASFGTGSEPAGEAE